MALATFDFEKPIVDLEQELERLKNAPATEPIADAEDRSPEELATERAQRDAERAARQVQAGRCH